MKVKVKELSDYLYNNEDYEKEEIDRLLEGIVMSTKWDSMLALMHELIIGHVEACRLLHYDPDELKGWLDNATGFEISGALN